MISRMTWRLGIDDYSVFLSIAAGVLSTACNSPLVRPSFDSEDTVLITLRFLLPSL